jgi:GH24 family phage-related lysozyme (muramidase)
MSTNYDFLDPSIDRRLAADVDAAEGNRLTAYEDTLGNWTCGRGHLLPPAAPGRSWEGFTVIESTSDRWFNGDLLDAIALAKKWPEYAQCDTPARQNALAEIAFNMHSKWAKFEHARAAIAAQDWPAVKQNLLWNAPDVKTQWYAEVGERAERIGDQFLTGQYPGYAPRGVEGS